MNTRLLLLLLLCGLTTMSAAGESIVLETDDEYPPYSYMENGQFKGIYVELFKRAAKLLAPKYELVLKPVPRKRGFLNLASGKSLGLVGTYRREERTYIEHYSVPFHREVLALFCTEQVMNRSPRHFPADFAGLAIGINLGFNLGERINSASKAKTLTLRETRGNEANLLKLQAGTIDCYANDRLAVYYTFNRLVKKQRERQFNQYQGFRLTQAQELSTEDIFIGYSAANTSSSKADFIEQMNNVLGQLKKEGVIDELIAQAIDPGR